MFVPFDGGYVHCVAGAVNVTTEIEIATGEMLESLVIKDRVLPEGVLHPFPLRLRYEHPETRKTIKTFNLTRAELYGATEQLETSEGMY